MPNTKKYVITSITLGSIAAIAALAIAGTNLLTKDRIAENEAKSQQKALSAIYSDAVAFSDAKTDFKLDKVSYLVNYYIAYKDTAKSEEIGYVYYTSGRNAYGDIAMMVGVNETGIGQISIVKNTESYATTLEDNYISKYQEGTIGLDDVSCGATYGAKLIKNMAYEAQSDYTLQKGGN